MIYTMLWNRTSLFWKTFILTMLLVGVVVTIGELGEAWLEKLLLGHGSGFNPTTKEVIIWFLASLLPSVVGSFVLSNLVVGPLRRLTSWATHLAGRNLNTRVDKRDSTRGDEVGALARSFDTMAQRLEKTIEIERHLLGDISHELRSPLTRMGMALALVQRSCSTEQMTTCKTIQPYLERIECEIGRMNQLVHQLLTQAQRASEAAQTGDAALKTMLDLCDILAENVNDASFEGAFTHTTFALSMPKNMPIYGNRLLLHQAINNVLTNALHYTVPGTNIDVSLELENRGHDPLAVVRVRDHGPGVPEKALEQIFRPFCRVDEARDRVSGGVGLGLALVQQAVQQHGGIAYAENAPDGGLVVTLCLPLHTPTNLKKQA